MRKPAFLLLAALALPCLAATYGSIVIRDGDHHYAHGDSSDISRNATHGRHYAFFERDGVGYVIRDAATLDRLRKIVEPQTDLGRQQAKLGAEQAALGAKQAELGAKQAALGMKQAAAADSARARELAGQQHELSQKQHRLSEQQQPLAEQQRILGEKQREAAKTARREMEKVFEEAVRSGVAKTE
jgi:multidrug efflux pump subunit AcrA (membrane-fusion protein)